jgi:hypothetical protein
MHNWIAIVIVIGKKEERENDPDLPRNLYPFFRINGEPGQNSDTRVSSGITWIKFPGWITRLG